jgi:hypothetical protein
VASANAPWRAAPGLLVAAVVLCLESAGLIALGTVQFVRNDESSTTAAGVALVGYALLLLLLARNVLRGRRWSRGPTVVTQLIQLPVAWVLYQGPTSLLAATLALSAILALIGLLLPTSTAVFIRPRERNPAGD